ncbi:nitrite reductase [Nocardioides sp. BGMRC 2183]|nr:nitrite reductase [Nocardioides sp. BGMRC 2183]
MLRPWPAADGALVRVRVPGGRVPVAALAALLDVATRYGDGLVRLTGRANLQLRALPRPLPATAATPGAGLPEEVITAIEATGLLPSRSHDLARNILVSPQTGLAGGRTDLRPVLAALDRALCTAPALARLPGRFLFTLDDGRGDLADRHRDLGLVALEADRVQLRVGAAWGPVASTAEAVDALVGLAERFVALRGDDPGAAWHVDELDVPLIEARAPEPGAEVGAAALPFGTVPGGRHVPTAPDGAIDAALVAAWAATADLVVLTPFGGVLVPENVSPHEEENR